MPLGASRLLRLSHQEAAAAPSVRPVTITANGNAQFEASQKQFGPTSAYFDGSGDWLGTGALTSSGGLTGDFTIEWFVRMAARADNYLINNRNAGEYTTGSWQVATTSTSNMRVSINGASSTLDSGYSGNTWYHFALVRSGSTVTLYRDGASQATATYTGELFANTNEVYIGSYGNGSGGATDYLQGHMEEVRISDTARYTTGFSTPTSRFVNDGNTLLLMHMDGPDGGTAFDDDAYTLSFASDSYSSSVELLVPFAQQSYMYDWSASVRGSGDYADSVHDAANHELSTTQKKWSSGPDYVYSLESTLGGQSSYYDLNTSMPSAGSGTYVVEGWFYANNATSNANWCLSSADSGGRWLFGINSGSTFQFGNENNIGIGSGWHHLAIVCDSGSKRFYYDGIYKGAWVSSNTGFSRFYVGSFNLGDSNDFRGHIQDFRITIGSNRGYTGTNSSSANFTLPTQFIIGDGT